MFSGPLSVIIIIIGTVFTMCGGHHVLRSPLPRGFPTKSDNNPLDRSDNRIIIIKHTYIYMYIKRYYYTLFYTYNNVYGTRSRGGFARKIRECVTYIYAIRPNSPVAHDPSPRAPRKELLLLCPAATAHNTILL